MIGSGKSTSVEIFEQVLGKVSYCKMSDLIKQSLTEKHIVISRENLHDHANDQRRINGGSYWMKLALTHVNSMSNEYAIIDGIRNLSEIEELKNDGRKSILITVITNNDIRLNRLISRSREIDLGDKKRILSIMELETNTEDQYGHQVLECIHKADLVLNGNNCLEKFTEEVRQIALDIKGEL